MTPALLNCVFSISFRSFVMSFANQDPINVYFLITFSDHIFLNFLQQQIVMFKVTMLLNLYKMCVFCVYTLVINVRCIRTFVTDTYLTEGSSLNTKWCSL